MPDAYIGGFGTALPHRISQQRFLEVDAQARRSRGQSEATVNLIRQLAEGSQVRFRHSVEPCWLEDERRAGEGAGEGEDIFLAHDFDPPGWKRALDWQKRVPPLALRAAREAVANWGGSVSDITHVISTCTSGWSEPGLGCELIYGLGLSLDTQKQELNFNGCFCGMTCLRLARDLVRAGEARAVLVVAVETPSVQYDCVVTDISTLIAQVLFADGAAAFIVAPEGTWRFDRAGMSLVPNTRPMLRMAPDTTAPRDTYRMYLDRQVGHRLAGFFREERGRELIDGMLQRSPDEPPTLVVHPGGPAILEAVANVFVDRGWDEHALDLSNETLWNTGNLGAAAMLYVLAQSLPRATTDRVETLAFGPGVTVEWGALSRA